MLKKPEYAVICSGGADLFSEKLRSQECRSASGSLEAEVGFPLAQLSLEAASFDCSYR